MSKNGRLETSGRYPWDNPHGLGRRIMERHGRLQRMAAIRTGNRGIAIHRTSLAADIFRRRPGHRHELRSGAGFPFVDPYWPVSIKTLTSGESADPAAGSPFSAPFRLQTIPGSDVFSRRAIRYSEGTGSNHAEYSADTVNPASFAGEAFAVKSFDYEATAAASRKVASDFRKPATAMTSLKPVREAAPGGPVGHEEPGLNGKTSLPSSTLRRERLLSGAGSMPLPDGINADGKSDSVTRSKNLQPAGEMPRRFSGQTADREEMGPHIGVKDHSAGSFGSGFALPRSQDFPDKKANGAEAFHDAPVSPVQPSKGGETADLLRQPAALKNTLYPEGSEVSAFRPKLLAGRTVPAGGLIGIRRQQSPPANAAVPFIAGRSRYIGPAGKNPLTWSYGRFPSEPKNRILRKALDNSIFPESTGVRVFSADKSGADRGSAEANESGYPAHEGLGRVNFGGMPGLPAPGKAGSSENSRSGPVFSETSIRRAVHRRMALPSERTMAVQESKGFQTALSRLSTKRPWFGNRPEPSSLSFKRIGYLDNPTAAANQNSQTVFRKGKRESHVMADDSLDYAVRPTDPIASGKIVESAGAVETDLVPELAEMPPIRSRESVQEGDNGMKPAGVRETLQPAIGSPRRIFPKPLLPAGNLFQASGFNFKPVHPDRVSGDKAISHMSSDRLENTRGEGGIPIESLSATRRLPISPRQAGSGSEPPSSGPIQWAPAGVHAGVILKKRHNAASETLATGILSPNSPPVSRLYRAAVTGILSSGSYRHPLDHRAVGMHSGRKAETNIIPLPLVSGFAVQRSGSAGDTHLDAWPGIQRQEVSNGNISSMPAGAAPAIEAPQSPAAVPETDTLSPDDVVDKVWRKLMRKLAMEQEKTGGSRRWVV